MINTNVPVNEKRQNALIKLNDIDEDKLKKFGFINTRGNTWCYTQKICDTYPVSFNVLIKKLEQEVIIDVLDDNFLQNYNYQIEIIEGNKRKLIIGIHNNVQAIMKRLMDSGIIKGYVQGDYI